MLTRIVFYQFLSYVQCSVVPDMKHMHSASVAKGEEASQGYMNVYLSDSS